MIIRQIKLPDCKQLCASFVFLCGSVVAPAPLDSPQRHKEHRGGTEKLELVLMQKSYCHCYFPSYNRAQSITCRFNKTDKPQRGEPRRVQVKFLLRVWQ